jgi:hypothetical protein
MGNSHAIKYKGDSNGMKQNEKSHGPTGIPWDRGGDPISEAHWGPHQTDCQVDVGA